LISQKGKIDIVIPARNKQNIRPELLQVIKNEPRAGRLIITEEKPLSVARKNACLRAETEWVAMFDDDMIIPPEWFDLVVEHVGGNVGAISTVADSIDRDFRAYQTVVNQVFPLESMDTVPHINNILIRRKLMESYNPPRLFLSEDWFMKRHVEKAGYVWKTIGRIGVINTGSEKSAVGVGIAYNRFGHYSVYQLTRRFVARLFLSPFAMVLTRRLKTLRNLWHKDVEFFAGWLKETFR